jgi:hypothetical protein
VQNTQWWGGGGEGKTQNLGPKPIATSSMKLIVQEDSRKKTLEGHQA